MQIFLGWVHFHHHPKSEVMLGGQVTPSAKASVLALVAVTFHYRYLTLYCLLPEKHIFLNFPSELKN